jgi:phosphotransferase system enzyme I (PtsP)
MLDTLRRIVLEVNAAKALQKALDIIVSKVREAMHTEVCSAYLYDDEVKRYFLSATEGLNQSAVGEVSLAYSEGIVGLVGSREELVNLEDASTHAKYQYLPGTGEEIYHAFMGVPIIHRRKLLGVLVIQQKEKRRFDENEEAFLFTMSAQLAAVIAHAEATGALIDVKNPHKEQKDGKFKGVAGAPGIAIGTVAVIYPPANLDAVPEKSTTNIDEEIIHFQLSLDRVRNDIRKVSDNLSSELSPEEQALFDVYLKMLDDNALGIEVINRIKQGSWAQGALCAVVRNYVRHFEMMEDAYLRERASDIKDLAMRVLAYLQESEKEKITYPDNCILVSDDLTPAMLGEIPVEKLLGLVSVKGSSNSHVSILARAMGIPTVMGAGDLPFSRLNGVSLIVDGYRGRIFTNPSDTTLKHYRAIVQEERQLVKGLESLKTLPAQTKDGHRIPLWVNTGLITDAVRSLEKGAEGVGLYRTEVPFMLKERFPSEKEQIAIYKEQLETFYPHPVTMRTLDIGGDKALSYFPIEEDNPFLGWRGIRITLDHPEIFILQIRAMLIASEGLNNLRIMLPMITSVAEVEEAQFLIYRAYEEVISSGFNVEKPKVGALIEVPAAVYQIPQLASHVDFLSVGSNDLTQYILAVDRNNPRVADLYNGFHPSVLLALKNISDDAHKANISISICGEMAGTPAGAILLMAMGYDMLSMNAANLPKVKSVIRHINLSWAKKLLSEVLTLDNASIIMSTVDLAIERAGLARLIRPTE